MSLYIHEHSTIWAQYNRILTRNIYKQNCLENIAIGHIPTLSRRNRLVDQPTLAANAQWVQDEKGIIPQPAQPLRNAAHEQVCREKRVPNDLGDAPRNQHASVQETGRRLGGKVVDNAPDEQQPAGHLHGRGEQRGTHESWPSRQR